MSRVEATAQAVVSAHRHLHRVIKYKFNVFNPSAWCTVQRLRVFVLSYPSDETSVTDPNVFRHPESVIIGTDPEPSIHKQKTKKNLDFYSFVTSY